MLKIGTIKETNFPPTVVNPLSVSENSSGKKRFILDLTYVNQYLNKQKVRFDDWKCFENYLREDQGFLFKFDLKSGYYHIDIFESHQTYLGFSWEFEGITRYFIFTVLPFGLSTAPFIFTKTVRPLIKYWRSLGIKIACFLDDGLGTELDEGKAKYASKIVYETLIHAGFVPNIKKSIWVPTKTLTWLGIEINLSLGTLQITSERITSIIKTANFLLSKKYLSARNLAKFTGKIISTNTF